MVLRVVYTTLIQTSEDNIMTFKEESFYRFRDVNGFAKLGHVNHTIYYELLSKSDGSDDLTFQVKEIDQVFGGVTRILLETKSGEWVDCDDILTEHQYSCFFIDTDLEWYLEEVNIVDVPVNLTNQPLVDKIKERFRGEMTVNGLVFKDAQEFIDFMMK